MNKSTQRTTVKSTSKHVTAAVLVIAATWSASATAGTNTTFGSLVGYVRSDNVSTVVYQSNANEHIWELSLVNGGWGLNDLTQASGSQEPAADSGISAYVRSDKTDSILFLNQSFEIDELYLTPNDPWGWNNLSTTHAAAATGWERSDSVNNAVFCDPANGHVEETYLSGASWLTADLTAKTGSAVCVGTPFGYVRGDGINSIAFLGSDEHVHEIYLKNGSWGTDDLSSLTKAPNAAGLSVNAYVRSDGVTSILYLATDSHIHEIYLQSGSWGTDDLTQHAGAPIGVGPVGYVRSDGVTAVTYLTNNLHVEEIYLASGTWNILDLTAAAGAPPVENGGASGPSTLGPFPYVRSDGVNAVVFGAGSTFDIFEISLAKGASSWKSNNLTAASGH